MSGANQDLRTKEWKQTPDL